MLLAEALDTTPEFWMRLQADYDLWHALRNRAMVKRKGSAVVARAPRATAAPAPGRHRSAWARRAAPTITASDIAPKRSKAGV